MGSPVLAVNTCKELIVVLLVWVYKLGSSGANKAKPMMAKRKKTDFVQFKIRFRESLRSRLEQAAKGQERSLNSEIVARLEESFDREGVIRIRDQAEKAIESMVAQNQRREKLLTLENKKFRQALEEYYEGEKS
jgi:hypothetical protein